MHVWLNTVGVACCAITSLVLDSKSPLLVTARVFCHRHKWFCCSGERKMITPVHTWDRLFDSSWPRHFYNYIGSWASRAVFDNSVPLHASCFERFGRVNCRNEQGRSASHSSSVLPPQKRALQYYSTTTTTGHFCRTFTSRGLAALVAWAEYPKSTWAQRDRGGWAGSCHTICCVLSK